MGELWGANGGDHGGGSGDVDGSLGDLGVRVREK